MKRLVVITVISMLTLAGCGGGKSVGDDDILNFKESNSASPTPTRTRAKPTKTASAEPSPTRTQTSQRATCPEKKPYKIVIRNVNDGFEPHELLAVRGCKITFTNLDPDRAHSWVSGNGSNPDEAGKQWKSPTLGYKKSWTWTVDIPGGKKGTLYQFHDGEVPYILGNLFVVEIS